MPEKLDHWDIKILEGLGIYGPRNIGMLARKLGMKRGTVWKRVRRLSSLFLLKFHVNIYHTNLGLKKAVVLAWAAPGREDLLFDCLLVNDFRNYISRFYGTSEGCFAIYTIPKEHTSEFEHFLHEIENLRLTKDIQVFWSTCFRNVNLTSNWFDAKSDAWVFPWDSWIEEIAQEETELPYTLVDPKDFPVRGDEIDIFILQKLEVDAARSFVDIGKMLGVRRQTIEHHYQNHILKRGLIEDVQVSVAPFDGRGMAELVFFNFRFEDKESLAKFALSLLDKPFVHFLGKVLNESALVAYLHFLSKKDFRSFISALSKVIRRHFLQDYSYVLIDDEKRVRESIRHELFKDGSWMYDHEEYLKRLHNLVSERK
jgi:DNA-binding Lrp family transcriptional regulator